MCLRLDLELTHYLPEARLKLSPPKCWVCTASPYQTSNFLRRFSATHPGRQKNKKWPVVLLLMPSPVQGKAEGLRQRGKPQQHRIEVEVGWGRHDRILFGTDTYPRYWHTFQGPSFLIKILKKG